MLHVYMSNIKLKANSIATLTLIVVKHHKRDLNMIFVQLCFGVFLRMTFIDKNPWCAYGSMGTHSKGVGECSVRPWLGGDKKLSIFMWFLMSLYWKSYQPTHSCDLRLLVPLLQGGPLPCPTSYKWSYNPYKWPKINK